MPLLPRLPAFHLACRPRTRVAGPFVVAFWLSACSTTGDWHSSPAATIKIASPNAGERRPVLIVLHHTGENSFAAALHTLTSPAAAVSAHYLIGRDGEIAQLVDERRRAWHAGDARWLDITDINSVSLGIELDNTGSEPFPPDQIRALLVLLGDLTARYGIDRRNIVGHADIAPSRKDDPSALFPWQTLAENGFGLWCSNDERDATPVANDEATDLRLVGYSIADNASTNAARHAFKLHFAGRDDPLPLTSDERAMLACVAKKNASPPTGVRASETD